MKIFLIWAARYEEIKELIWALQKEGHKILYWVGSANDEGKIPGAIFHNHYAAWAGFTPPAVDINGFPPPDKALIEYFYKVESVILTMMNKLFDRLCVDERKHIYYNMLRYWHGVLKKYEPEMIIFPVYPHTVYNYIIYELAKMLSIKTVMFDNPWVGYRLLLYGDWQQGSAALQRKLKEYREKKFSINDLNDELQAYYRLHTEGKRDATPIYTKNFRDKVTGRKNALFRILKIMDKTIKDGTILERGIKYLFKRFKPDLSKEYVKLQIAPDFTKNFVYVPLSFQPEASTSPLGDIFVDQILMIEILSFCLPRDWIIYVKEHPGQWWLRSRIYYSSSRYPGYYNRIASIKNVRLVPIDTNTYSLINNSRAVATGTGTAGWEAILRGKATIIFGYPWYRDCPGLFRVSDVESTKEAFKKIIDGFCPNKQEIINYLKSYEEASIPGYLETIKEMKDLKLTRDESTNNITQAILSEIRKI